MSSGKARLLALLALTLSACSLSGGVLTSKSPPPELRYFSPEPVGEAWTETSTPREGAPRIRLGHVRSAANLRSHILYRASAYELGEYDDLRWSDAPEAYVRRALDRALYGDRRARLSNGGPAPTLDVELIAFEEVRRPKGRAGAVELTYSLSAGSDVITTGHTRVEREAAGNGIEAVIAAISAALTAAAEDVARAAVTALEPTNQR